VQNYTYELRKLGANYPFRSVVGQFETDEILFAGGRDKVNAPKLKESILDTRH